MKPDWDKLMDAYAESPSQLVADVDCTAEGKPLCEAHGIQGFPTLKWGDPNALEDYEGARDFDALEQFAKENLKPMCSPANLDLCDDEKKAEIKKFQDMAADELDKQVQEIEDALEKIDDDFENAVDDLEEEFEKRYQEFLDERDEKSQEVNKDNILSIMKAVKALKDAESGAKEEL